MYRAAMPDQTDLPDRSGDRIAKLLARAGIASRREIERMIAEGRVALGGVVLDTPATVLRNLRGVTVDGEPVAPPEAARLFLYHKPTGLLVTEHDPVGRPVIYDQLPRDLPRTMPVGRLDLATEGLLLLTTDGGLKRQLELPATGVERTYRARAYGNVTQAMLEELAEGIEIDGIRYGPIDANLERRTGANTWIELTLTEGKNREVRRVLEHLGLQVGRLIRTRYGPFVLGDLPPGDVGEVKQHDLVAFARTLAGPRRAKGADLDHIIAVEVRPKAPRPAPAPAPAAPAARAPRPTTAAAPRVAKPTSSWGSRTRPSRPESGAEPKPARGTFRAADTGAPRERAPARPVRERDVDIGSSARAEGVRKRPSARAGATQGTARPSRTASDPRRDRAQRDDAPPAGGQRPVRGASDPRPRTPSTGAPVRGGKGPAGGRGHPPRGKPSTPKPGGPRGKR